LASASVLLAVWNSSRPEQGPDFAGVSCERVMELSDAYLNKQLSPDLQDQLRRHIALCPNCRGMFDDMPQASQARVYSSYARSPLLPATISRRHPYQR